MTDEDPKFEGIPADIAIFNQLVLDNDSLKQRVDALEKSFKDAQREILSLQECISTLLSTELQEDNAGFRTELRRTENNAHNEYPNDGSRIRCEKSQYVKEFWHSDDSPENNARNVRESSGYSKERHPSLNRFNSYEDRRSNSYCKPDDRYTNKKLVKRYERSPERDSRRRVDRSAAHSLRGRYKPERNDSIREIQSKPEVSRHSSPHRNLGNDHASGARSSSRQQYYDAERRSRDNGQRSPPREKRQQRDSKYSEERHRSTERLTFSEHRDEHGRSVDSFRRGQRSERSNELRLSNEDSARRINSDDNLRRSLRSERSNEPRLSNKDSARKIDNSEHSQRRIQDSATVKRSPHPKNDIIIPQIQPKKPVINLKEEMAKVASIQKREQREKGEERKTCKLDMPSSSGITLWSDGGEMRTIIRSEDLDKIHFTPMKLISNFAHYELLSPLQNTPDPPKDKFKEISPLSLLSKVPHENKRELPDNNVNVESVPLVLPNTSFESVERPQSRKRDSVAIQTVVKTDDAEHGVFQRKRRMLTKAPMA